MSRVYEISISDQRLIPLLDKVANEIRLTREDGILLDETVDFHTVAQLADVVREKKHGKKTGYIINAHLNYTNVCVSQCKFCAFWRRGGAEDAYTLKPEDAVRRIPEGVDEIHLVGGVNPYLRLEYFKRLLAALNKERPGAVLKAFTAVEIHALAKREKRSVADILSELKGVGLKMLPGGGAEIFSESVRKVVCPNKASKEEWLDVHRIAHGMGIKSNSTMLHGHIENRKDRVDHLLALRALQDETGGIIAHIPLPYLPGSNELGEVHSAPDGTMDIRQIALARLMLDNVTHIKAYWRALGLKLAQVALHAGADDIDGTIGREDIMHEAGSDAPRSLSGEHLEKIITDAGLEPYRRNSFHKPVDSGKQEYFPGFMEVSK